MILWLSRPRTRPPVPSCSLVWVCVVVGLSACAGSGTSTTKTEALHFAQAVNLRATDLPKASVLPQTVVTRQGSGPGGELFNCSHQGSALRSGVGAAAFACSNTRRGVEAWLKGSAASWGSLERKNRCLSTSTRRCFAWGRPTSCCSRLDGASSRQTLKATCCCSSIAERWLTSSSGPARHPWVHGQRDWTSRSRRS